MLDAVRTWAGRPVRIPPQLPDGGPGVLSIRQAMLSPQETLPLSKCFGRVLAADTAGCPPAVPIERGGARLERKTLALYEYYGIKELRVVRNNAE